jgi:hypothetical protein
VHENENENESVNGISSRRIKAIPNCVNKIVLSFQLTAVLFLLFALQRNEVENLLVAVVIK